MVVFTPPLANRRVSSDKYCSALRTEHSKHGKNSENPQKIFTFAICRSIMDPKPYFNTVDH